MKNKKYLYIFVLCALSLCTLVGCKKDPEKEPDTFVSNVARPTWAVPSDYDYSSSMTAVVKVNLKAQYPDKAADFVLDGKDLLAAFSGQSCIGVASQLENGLFNLYIASPAAGSPSSITLRYYSAHYKNLFEAKDAFIFSNNSRRGTPDNPFIPAFVVVK